MANLRLQEKSRIASVPSVTMAIVRTQTRLSFVMDATLLFIKSVMACLSFLKDNGFAGSASKLVVVYRHVYSAQTATVPSS